MKKILCVMLSVMLCMVFSVTMYATEAKEEFVSDPSGIAPITSGRSVFGEDDRGYISDPTIFPYKAIAKLIINYPNTGTYPYHGTGFMYGSKSMATAAHNLYDASKGGYATKITAYFGASNI